MAAESRTDSLAAELKRQGLFDEYFSWRFRSKPSFAACQEWLAEKNLPDSAGTVHRLHQSPEAREWRFAEAAIARKALDDKLPMDMEETIRKSLLDQRFNQVLGGLTHKELMDHLIVEGEKEKAEIAREKISIKKEEVGLTRQKFQRDTCKLFIEWMANEQAKAIVNGSGSNEEKINALGQAMFEDWNEE